ncbi:hypothetical protein [Methylophaga sp. OBS1]|uniref:hypothetical protein n=1 Tax=Methylophaga sp. OBS1 TaxID=2991933 RepID=UPI002259DAD1|nr:hypothetical protein [Methylophaga sp. OBS1]MCX4192555.1 hypothetical protein [Methylophaga sp. OBS1]
MAKQQTLHNDWLSKTVAGLILGFTAALGLSGVLLLIVSEMNRSASAQLVMWLLSPMWLTLLSTVYLFRNGLRAWGWLALLNLMVYALFFLIKSLS